MSGNAPIGFLGLGIMGLPIALNLLRSGQHVIAWNRTRSAADILNKAGGVIADSPDEVFEHCNVVLMMLADEHATDSVLHRDVRRFGLSVKNRLLVNMATVSPEYSKDLEADVVAAGGRFAEAPVSGSRQPAERGELVGLLAGPPEDVQSARAVLAPACREMFCCGPIPNATFAKLAVNTFLISMVTGLAEAFHLADRAGLERGLLARIIDAGPMASPVSRIKAAKLAEDDRAVQASISNVAENARLIVNAASRLGAASPVLDACQALYRESAELGLGGADMISVLTALEARALDTKRERNAAIQHGRADSADVRSRQDS